MNSQIIWIGRHEGLLRDTARACAYGDPLAIKQCAFHLAARLPDYCTLIPMPSHIGYATTMKSLCESIQSVKNRDTGLNGVKVWDGLVCNPHESSHIVKLRHGVVPNIIIYATKHPPDGRLYIIDNTIASGATASAALQAIPNATVMALTKR